MTSHLTSAIIRHARLLSIIFMLYTVGLCWKKYLVLDLNDNLPGANTVPSQWAFGAK